MAARKKSSKKSVSKKTPAKKTATAKKAAKKVSNKKVTKKVTKKVAKKAPANKAASKKKSAKKAVSKKKVAKKTPAKKAASKKKAVSKKKPTAKKKVVKKAPSKKKTITKKAVSKKKVAKKAPAKKTASKKKVATKAPVTKTPVKKKKVVAKKPKEKRIISKPTPPKRVRPAERTRNVEYSDAEDAIHGIAPYKAKASEHYMNDDQLDHFEAILLAWKSELMKEVDRTMLHMQDEASNFPDPTDRATQESEFGLELRTRDRERKLIKKIDSTLKRVEEGDYGYCEETGEEIGLKRLEARPVATLSVEAQERRELAERQFRDSDDRYR